MRTVVELQGGESLEVKSNQMNPGDGSEGIVRGISFENNLHIWNPMSQYQCGGEGFLHTQ